MFMLKCKYKLIQTKKNHMLKIKHKHHLDFPHLTFSGRTLDFSPLKADEDELTVAITNDTEERDDTWELNERPDMRELTAFWSEVEADVANDPSWFKMSAE